MSVHEMQPPQLRDNPVHTGTTIYARMKKEARPSTELPQLYLERPRDCGLTSGLTIGWNARIIEDVRGFGLRGERALDIPGTQTACLEATTAL
jgi:hypothetical protein